MDDRMFRTAMGKFATGVTVIAAEAEEEIRGMTANAFMSVSLDPKLILISVADNARMNKMIKQAKKFTINILNSEQKETSMIFAGQLQSGKEVTFGRFEGLPMVKDALVSFACDLYQSHEAGDHTLFLGEVINLSIQDGEPLAFYEGKYMEVSACENMHLS